MNFFFFDSIDSTHLHAKRYINLNDKIEKDILICSNKMTNGQSTKKDIPWFSPSGNLYFSLIFKNEIKLNQIHIIFCTSIAIINLIKKISVIDNDLIKIKWPNDILINEKKIAGSMAENYKNYLILSIGMNIIKHPKKTYNFPATNLQNEDKENFIYYEYDNIKYCLYLYDLLIKEINNFQEFGFEYLKSKWKKMAYKLNEYLFFQKSKELIKLKFIDLYQNGNIILKDKNHNIFIEPYGEIVFKVDNKDKKH